MEKDISNETVAILAVLTILISILSVSTIVMQTSNTESDEPTIDSTTGIIKLELNEIPQESNSQGQINLQINNRN